MGLGPNVVIMWISPNQRLTLIRDRSYMGTPGVSDKCGLNITVRWSKMLGMVQNLGMALSGSWS